MQDRTDEDVAEWKREGIIRALRTVGIETQVDETRTVPASDRRRVKLAFQRTKKTTLLGFYGGGSHTIIPVPDCKIARPEILAAMPALANLLRLGAPRKRALALTVTVSDAGLDVAVADGKEADLAMRAALGQAAADMGLARLVWNDEPVAQARPPAQQFGKARVVPPPGAFLQASANGEALLREFVLEHTSDVATALDLFAGCGAFSLPLAETAMVTAVEGDANMIAALDAGWRQAEGLKTVTAITRDLFRRPYLPDELNKFDAVVFDPPRNGAKAQAEHIAQSNVPTVVGVSCMPSSFARDAATLIEGGYHLERVLPVDQFRWSGHIEMAGVFRRHTSSRSELKQAISRRRSYRRPPPKSPGYALLPRIRSFDRTLVSQKNHQCLTSLR